MTPNVSLNAGDHAIQFGYIEHLGNLSIGHEQVARNGILQVQIGSIVGGVVNITSPDIQLPPRPRTTPILLRARPFPLLLGRREEVKVALEALPYNQPVEFYGLAGIGKTALLRYLSYHPGIVPAFADGVIYHCLIRHQTASDILQVFFTAFYESHPPFKGTDPQMRYALQDKKALILLDGASLTREDINGLLNDLPNCTFLFASLERQLWGEGRAVGLQGLTLQDAVALVTQELGHTLSPDERSNAEKLCMILECHPLRILQAVALGREEKRSLAAIAQQCQSAAAAPAQLAKHVFAGLLKPERMILSLLVALGANVALGAERIADMTKLLDIKPMIEALLRRNLLQVEGDRYSLSQTLVEPLQQQWDRSPWMEHVTAYFTNWVQQKQVPLQQLLEERDAILSALEWAVQSGRWATVLSLGRAVEGGLALSGQWGTWALVLQWILEAARITGDRTFEAFALHQLGTRSLCLNETTAAYDYLTQALHIRESLNDPAGLAATRHNLNVLLAPPPTPTPTPAPITPPPQHRPPFILGASAGALLLALGLPFLASQCSNSTPIVTSTTTPISTPTPIPTTSSTTPITTPLSPQLSQLKSLELPPQVGWGQTVNGTIALTSPAPQEGIEVMLEVQGDPYFVGRMPRQVLISPNSVTAPFSFTTPKEGSNYPNGGTFKIIATCPKCQGTPQAQQLTIAPFSPSPKPSQPPQLKSLELPQQVDWGQTVNGTIALTSPAPQEGVEVMLEVQGDPYFVGRMPRQVSIDPNSATVSFSFRTPRNGSNYPRGGQFKIVATCPKCQGIPQSQLLTITPFKQPTQPQQLPQLRSLELPQQVGWGQAVNGTITLISPAPEGGLEVVLMAEGESSSYFVRDMPKTVRVSPNSSIATFLFTTPKDGNNYPNGGQLKIVATCTQCQGGPQSQQLTIMPFKQSTPGKVGSTTPVPSLRPVPTAKPVTFF